MFLINAKRLFSQIQNDLPKKKADCFQMKVGVIGDHQNQEYNVGS